MQDNNKGSPFFNDLLNNHIEVFYNQFINLSKSLFSSNNSCGKSENNKYIHTGEFGIYRERICENFLRFFTPSSFSMDTGFVIDAQGYVSNQCDIIIHDSNSTPQIQFPGVSPRFFPIETVLAVGEIKSCLEKKDLKASLSKLTEIKKSRISIKSPSILKQSSSLTDDAVKKLILALLLQKWPLETEQERENICSILNNMKINNFNPIENCHDQIFTFLICDKFNFNIDHIEQDIDLIYKDINEPTLRHNMILSLKDGLLFYCDSLGKNLPYPKCNKKTLKNRFIIPDENKFIHIKYFCNYFFMAMSSITILYPEITNYLGEESLKGGMQRSQPYCS